MIIKPTTTMIGNHELELLPSGTAYWPACNSVIVSDLHLEKGSHFARRGFFLPPYDSHETLHRLVTVCEQQDARQLIILGDCFHDPQGYGRLPDDARSLFDRLLDFHPVWIKGNHDRDFVPPGFTAYEMFEQDGLVFRHQAEPGASNEISGHFHPKIKLIHKGEKVERPCFVEDGYRMILPAFGSYTGGLYVNNPVIATLFGDSVQCHLLGKGRVFTVSYETS